MAHTRTSGAGWVADPRAPLTIKDHPMAAETPAKAEAAPTPDAMTQIAAVLSRLADQPDRGMSADQITALVTAAAANAANTGAESMRRVLHPQNAQHPGKSVFSYPEGDIAHPKAVLRPRPDGQPGVVFFCGSREDPDQLTPAQIDLYNRFDRSRTSRDGKWKAEIASNGIDLMVWVPAKSIDERMDLPSLDLILLELLDGTASVDPVSLAERVAQLEQQLAAQAARP